MLPYSCINHDSNTCPLREWHICKSTARVPHTPTLTNRRYTLSSMHSPTVKKGKSCQIRWVTLPDTPKTRPSLTTWQNQPDKTCLGSGAWQATLTCNFFTLVEVTTLENGKHLSTLGGSTNLSPFACQDYYLRHQTDSLDMGQPFFDTWQSLLPASQLKAWGAYVLSRTYKMHVTSYMALKDMCPPSTSPLLQKRGRLTLSSRVPQQPSYL